MLLANIAGEITLEDEEPPPPVNDAERNQAILERDSLFIAAGPRVTAYLGDTIMQFRWVSDWYDGNGMQGSLRIGRHWQIRNWNYQFIAGARYYTSEFADYLYGVDGSEATPRFPEFTAGSAWIPDAEIGVSTPVTPDWIFRSRLRMRYFPDSVMDSPLIDARSSMIFSTGFHYVF